MRAYIFQDDWRVEAVSTHTDAGLMQSVVQELLNTRKQLLDVKQHLASGHVARASEVCGNSLMLTRVGKRHDTYQAQKSATSRRFLHDSACIAIGNNLAYTHIGSVAHSFADVFGVRGPGGSSFGYNVANYLVVLSDAVELYTAQSIKEACSPHP